MFEENLGPSHYQYSMEFLVNTVHHHGDPNLTSIITIIPPI